MQPVRLDRAPSSLMMDERQAVLDLLRGERFVDLAPVEVYASLLDEGARYGQCGRS
jgi:putative transposase